MTIYTVIGYRENGRYYDERSDSQIEIQIFDTMEEAVEQAFEFQTRTERQFGNTNNAWHYNEWEVRFLVDGRDEDYWLDENEWTPDNPFNTFSSLLHIKRAEWQDGVKAREKEAEKEAARKKKREKAASAAAKTKSEKKLLAELKKKYPDA